MHDYKHRVKKKLCKYIKKYGAILAFILIIRYILRDLINYTLTILIKRIIGNKTSFKNKRILFIEPFQQGFGDLIFQTPIFESLNSQGYSVYVLINQNHLPIIENNFFIEKIILRGKIKYWIEILYTKFETIFVLSRDTIPETLIPLFKFRSQIILMDSDLKFWNEIFDGNHTLAWQKILKKYFNKSLKFNRPMIFLESKPVVSKKIIGIIAGVDKEEKNFKNMILLIKKLKMFNINLFGKNKEWVVMAETDDYVNKLTYKETIKKISECNLIIGTESSLIHVSTTLKIPTLIIENSDRPFNKYSALNNEDHIHTINENENLDEIINRIKSIIVK